MARTGACTVERAAARVRSRAATHDMTEEEVTAWEK